jgi:hypothetical protein
MEVLRASFWRPRVVVTRDMEVTVEGWEKRRFRWFMGS